MINTNAENQRKYRDNQRRRGMKSINRWTHDEIKKEVYTLIGLINRDFKNGETGMINMLLDALSAPDDTRLQGKKENGRWKFTIYRPQ